MKATVSIGLALLVLLPSFSKAWIVLSFQINRNYIAKVLCINRDKPERLCSGKCVLTQRMKAGEAQDNKQLPQRENDQTQYCFASLEQPAVTLSDWPAGGGFSFFYRNPCSSSFVQGIFRPPCPVLA